MSKTSDRYVKVAPGAQRISVTTRCKARNSLWPAFAHEQAESHVASKIAACILTSVLVGPVAQFRGCTLLLGFGKQEVELAASSVLLDLSGPRGVVLFNDEPCQLGQLFRRKLTHRAFDLGKAHG